jgi:hypothetical protein
VNADKTEYMFMSGDQNAGRCHNINTDNSSLEMVKEFKCLGRSLTNQNSIQEEIKSRLRSGNACYDSARIFYLPVCCANIKRLRYTEI